VITRHILANLPMIVDFVLQIDRDFREGDADGLGTEDNAMPSATVDGTNEAHPDSCTSTEDDVVNDHITPQTSDI
jgi:hypothetical protein